MRIWTNVEAGSKVLFVACDTDHEATVLNELGRHNDTFVATLKHDIGYLHPHLEIRKEQT